MIKVIVLVSLLFLSTGCALSKIDFQGGSLSEVVQNDVESAADLLIKYGNPTEAKCGTFLKGAFEANAGLRAEVTKGLISGGTKLYLLQRYVNTNKQAFINNCAAVAANIVIQAGDRID